jgi:hypothetical protein
MNIVEDKNRDTNNEDSIFEQKGVINENRGDFDDKFEQ